MGCNNTKVATDATTQKPASPEELALKVATDATAQNPTSPEEPALKVATETTAQKPTPPEEPAPPVLTEISVEERALTQLKLIFDSTDTNEDGSVSKAELVAALDKNTSLGSLIKEAGFNPNYGVLEQLDTNADGRVTWGEFESHLKQAALVEVSDTVHVAAAELPADEKALKQLKKLFEMIDANADAAISKEELSEGLNKDESVGKLVEEAGFNPQYYILEQLDTNSDGRITWDEFEAHLRRAAKEEVKEQGEVMAAVVLEEQKKQAETTEEPNGVVVPKGIWCC